jgi:OmpA-OmpF porin, OOP family
VNGAHSAKPPRPPAPSYEARQFIVYFAFDQYLAPEAQTGVSEAANYARNGNATRVVVVGHADTSGSLASNPQSPPATA